MPTKIEICNLALNRIAANPIATLDEGTASAKAVTFVYDQALTELLAKHTWNFARTRRTLAPLADPELPPGWTFAYTLPSDMVRLMYIEGRHTSADSWWPPYRRPQGPHCVGANHEVIGQTIFTNVDEAIAVYTIRQENTALFPPLVTTAFIELLAARMVMPVKSDERRYTTMMQSALELINQAIAVDLNNQDMSIVSVSTYEQARC